MRRSGLQVYSQDMLAQQLALEFMPPIVFPLNLKKHLAGVWCSREVCVCMASAGVSSAVRPPYL